ncbi:MAG TPA: hypothetical protein VH620_03195, partial [Gaiella sp.]
GWGPGSARSASLAVARSDEVERAGRQWADAHDLFLETTVTSGIVGLVGLVWLAGLVLVRSLRAGPDRAWAFGAVAGLAAYSLVEPVGLVLTPLLFLFAGAATGPATGPAVERAGDEETARPAGRGLSIGVAGVLAIALVVAIQMQTAASFERWGRVYGEAWALRTALRVQPWRLSSAERLALNLALDGRAGDEDAAAEARRVIAEAVDEHPWDPDVRLWAADVETLLRDDAAAEAWVEEHLERFPGDVPGASGSEATGFENPAPGA